MPLTTWTLRDELLSDALDNYDRALGLTGEQPIADVDYEPMSQVEEEMERALRNANWGRVQDWRDLRQEIGKPNLTADDKDDVATATDRRRVVESRWRDGAACGLYIEQSRAADAHADLLIEPEQWDRMAQSWVEHTDKLSAVEEEEVLPLSQQQFTTPSHEALRKYYAPAFLQGTKGVRCIEFVGVPSAQVAANPHVRDAMRAKGRRRRPTRPSKVLATTLADRKAGVPLRSTHERTSHAHGSLALTARRDRLVTDHPLPLGLPAWQLRLAAVGRRASVMLGGYQIGTRPARDMRAIARLWARVDKFDQLNHSTPLSDEHFDLGQHLAVELVNRLVQPA